MDGWLPLVRVLAGVLVEGKGRQAYPACLVVSLVLITLPFRYQDYYVEFHDFCL
jgi:hypothetical protein